MNDRSFRYLDITNFQKSAQKNSFHRHFKEYPENTPFRNPLSVFYAKVFKVPGAATFIPIQRIQSRFIAINKQNQNVDLVIVCPILQRTFI